MVSELICIFAMSITEYFFLSEDKAVVAKNLVTHIAYAQTA